MINVMFMLYMNLRKHGVAYLVLMPRDRDFLTANLPLIGFDVRPVLDSDRKPVTAIVECTAKYFLPVTTSE